MDHEVTLMATCAEMHIRSTSVSNTTFNCGTCTATCPSAQFYDFSPHEIVQLRWTESVEQGYMSAHNLAIAAEQMGFDTVLAVPQRLRSSHGLVLL